MWSLILSLSLLHSSFAPVLSLLLTYPLCFFFFFFTFLRYANCLERVTSSTNCKWQGLIRFASQYLGRFFFFLFNVVRASVRTVRVWNFYSISLIFFFSSFLTSSVFFVFPFFRTTRSVASVRSAHLTGRSAIISLVPACGTSSRSSCSCDLSSRLLYHPVLPSFLSSEVRCVSLRIVMPPHYFNKSSSIVGYVLRVQCILTYCET